MSKNVEGKIISSLQRISNICLWAFSKSDTFRVLTKLFEKSVKHRNCWGDWLSKLVKYQLGINGALQQDNQATSDQKSCYHYQLCSCSS